MVEQGGGIADELDDVRAGEEGVKTADLEAEGGFDVVTEEVGRGGDDFDDVGACLRLCVCVCVCVCV